MATDNCFNCGRQRDLTEIRKYADENPEVPLLKKFVIFFDQESEDRSIKKFICDECTNTINDVFCFVERTKKNNPQLAELFANVLSNNTNSSNMPMVVNELEKFENSLNEEKPGDSQHAGQSDETLDEIRDDIENVSFNRKRRHSIGESEYGSSENLQQLPIVPLPNAPKRRIRIKSWKSLYSVVYEEQDSMDNTSEDPTMKK